MLTSLDIFDPSSYPTRRDEEWKYSDLSRALRAAPGKPLVVRTLSELESEPDGFTYFPADEAGFDGLQAAADHAVANSGRLYIDGNDFGDEGGYLGYQGAGHIELKERQSLVVFEDYTGAFDYAVNTQLRFRLAEGARLIRVVILDEPETAESIRRSLIETAPNSVFSSIKSSTPQMISKRSPSRLTMSVMRRLSWLDSLTATMFFSSASAANDSGRRSSL